MMKKIKLLIFILIIGALSLKFIYPYVPYKIDFIGKHDKIWSHRVNSIAKLKKAVHYYDGVEVDLIFKKKENYLDVNHPTTKSIHLNFENYIQEVCKLNKPSVWLDIKNLTIENEQAIYTIINKLVVKYKYPKERLLIETKYPRSLNLFIKNGYHCSYYLQFNSNKLAKDKLLQKQKSITATLTKMPNIALSFDIVNYDWVALHFSKQDKYTWSLKPFYRQSIFKTRKVLKDTTIKKVLVGYKTEGHR